jgi:hypothetical protein
VLRTHLHRHLAWPGADTLHVGLPVPDRMQAVMLLPPSERLAAMEAARLYGIDRLWEEKVGLRLPAEPNDNMRWAVAGADAALHCWNPCPIHVCFLDVAL